MAKDVIIACDFAGTEETLAFLEKFGAERPFVKIGMELFYAEGPQIVRLLKARGHKVFLDLKLHDIPNTVEKSMRVLRDLGADIVNLHAAGTKAMMERPLNEVVLAYAENAKTAGLDGVVCSPLEAGAVHSRCGEGFLTVTPGVRFAEGDKGDQKRVATPALARELGADYIVVGRPITRAEDPLAAYQRCVKEFLG